MPDSDQPDFENSPFCAYGPEKQAWKAQGNYFTPEELARMAADFDDLVIHLRRNKTYSAD